MLPLFWWLILIILCIAQAATKGVPKKAVPKTYAIFIRKHFCWILFSTKMQVLKSATDIFRGYQKRSMALNGLRSRRKMD